MCAPRCGAKTRRGSPCQCPAMANGSCRIHGGLSAGPETAEGIARVRRAVTKHGRYSAAARLERQRYRALLREGHDLIRRLRNEFVGRTSSCDGRGYSGWRFSVLSNPGLIDWVSPRRLGSGLGNELGGGGFSGYIAHYGYSEHFDAGTSLQVADSTYNRTRGFPL
ncbi:MAG: HGGxSTG domain-containing protein [Bryobacteraceae bacterium]